MRKVIFAIFLLLLSVIAQPAYAEEKTIVVATAGDVKPFDYQKNGKLTGYDIEVIKAASAYIDGYQFSFKVTSWDSIFVGLDTGHYQMAANNLSYTQERAAKYLYSVPIAKNPLVLVVAKNSKIRSLDDIGGKTTQDDVGTSTAQLVADWNSEHADQPSTIDYSGEDITKRLLDLDAGEFDYLIFDKVSVSTIIKQRKLNLKMITIDIDSNPNNYVIFANEQTNLQNQFNKAIKKLYQNGQLKKLSKKYLGGSYLPDAADLDTSN